MKITEKFSGNEGGGVVSPAPAFSGFAQGSRFRAHTGRAIHTSPLVEAGHRPKTSPTEPNRQAEYSKPSPVRRKLEDTFSACSRQRERSARRLAGITVRSNTLPEHTFPFPKHEHMFDRTFVLHADRQTKRLSNKI